jgi:hypothetical protein
MKPLIAQSGIHGIRLDSPASGAKARPRPVCRVRFGGSAAFRDQRACTEITAAIFEMGKMVAISAKKIDCGPICSMLMYFTLSLLHRDLVSNDDY